jgi:dockerin type I repeat protein
MSCSHGPTAGLISVASLLTIVVLLCGNLNAQVCDPLRWGNASAWKGSFSVSGNGSGALNDTCGTIYTNRQSAAGAPVLQGSYPQWVGPSFAVGNIEITTTSFCPMAPVCNQSIVGSGSPVDGDIFFLTIDEASCQYSLFLNPRINVTATGCEGDQAETQFDWGPIFGPGGASDVVAGLPAIQNGSTSTGVIPLPAAGVDLSYTFPPYKDDPDPFAATWNASWKLSPKCVVQIPNKYWQNNPQWGSDQYGKSAYTMGAKGCALTSLAMAMQYAYAVSGLQPPPEFSNPSNLNFFMTMDGDFNRTAVEWDKAARAASNNKLKFDNLGGFVDSVNNPTAAKQVLDYALCQKNPHPVIVGVKITSSGPTNSPGHFVLVTGRDEDGNYTIVDPATGATGSLDTYAGEFSTRGIVKDPPGDISSLDIDTDVNASLLVTDSSGNQTGTDVVSGNALQQIPGSAYFLDRYDDDLTGAVDPLPAHLINIATPNQGLYRIVVHGVANGPYNLHIDAFSQDGSPQPSNVISGLAAPGSTATYEVTYTSAPGTTSNVTALPGDRNGDGVVDCTDLGIVKASFGKSIGQAGFDPAADVNADGVVNIFDLATVARALPAGTACP